MQKLGILCKIRYRISMTILNKKNIVLLLTVIIIGLTGQSVSASVHNLGVLGATYSIAERDALEEIQERAKAVDWDKAFNRKKAQEKLKNYKPKNLAKLPRALDDKTFLVDMTYTLDIDIPDGKGNILYPKGYTFNPLEYVQFPNTIVVINGSDKEQVEWFSNSDYIHDYNVTFMISDGSYYDLMKKLKRPVYFADDRIINRFNLRAVPSVIRQKEKYMEVHEVDIKKKIIDK